MLPIGLGSPSSRSVGVLFVWYHMANAACRVVECYKFPKLVGNWKWIFILVASVVEDAGFVVCYAWAWERVEGGVLLPVSLAASFLWHRRRCWHRLFLGEWSIWLFAGSFVLAGHYGVYIDVLCSAWESRIGVERRGLSLSDFTLFVGFYPLFLFLTEGTVEVDLTWSQCSLLWFMWTYSSVPVLSQGMDILLFLAEV